MQPRHSTKSSKGREPRCRPTGATPQPAPGSGSGGGRDEAIKNVYFSDCQLPPGHDPGADCGEPPDGRQRGSQPCNVLVECRGCDRPRREVRTQLEDHCEQDEHGANEGPNSPEEQHGRSEARHSRPSRQPLRKRRGRCCHGHGDHGAHGSPCPPGRVTKACPVTAITAVTNGTAITAVTAASDADPDDHSGHGGHGGAVTAERATQAWVARLKPVSDAPPLPHMAGARAKSRSDGRGAITLDEEMMLPRSSSFLPWQRKKEMKRHATDTRPGRNEPAMNRATWSQSESC
jgi:hypothetical protein